MSEAELNESLDIVYGANPEKQTAARHILAAIVDNEFGVLNRVVGLFSARGYNIESLTVAEVDEKKNRSRITVVTTGTEQVITQIMHLLERLIPVHSVHDLSTEGPHVERELALVKVSGTGENRVEALRIADIFRARSVDATIESFIFEITGKSSKIDSFIDMMQPLGLVEIARTGAAAMGRGPQPLY